MKTDVLIIGGGMAGILCAYLLHRSGISYVLVEAQRVCGGISGHTTAKLTVQHGLLYQRLIRAWGVDRARLCLRANEAAVEQYRQLCRDIRCDFEEKDAYVYSRRDPGKLERELLALEQLGRRVEFTKDLPLPFPVAGAVRYPHQAQFHPLKFAAAIAKDLHIYEHTPVRQLVGTTAVTDGGTIRADNIIVATHFPFLNKHGSYFVKMYQHRSYVLALERVPRMDGMYVDEDHRGLSFRTYGDLLLVGGGGHRTGKKGGSWPELRDFVRRYYPDAVEKYHWAAQDCMTLDGAPYIGPYSAATSGLYVAAGFNKWGMTSSMVAALILRDLVQGKENPYAPAFSPSRTILRPQLAVNAFEAAAGWLMPAARRCPHLGCGLKWNPYEHSWDCPCHGSRFTASGEKLDNPATGDLKQGTSRNSGN